MALFLFIITKKEYSSLYIIYILYKSKISGDMIRNKNNIIRDNIIRGDKYPY